MVKTIIVVTMVILSACTTTMVAYDGPCEPRYQPILSSVEVQRGTTKAIRDLIDDETNPARALRINLIADHEERLQKELVRNSALNQRGFKQNIKDAEALSNCGD